MKDQINEKNFDDFPECESDRLIYREFNKNDACDLLLIRSDAQVMEFMDSPEYENIQDAEKAIIENQNLFKERQGNVKALAEILRFLKHGVGYNLRGQRPPHN